MILASPNRQVSVNRADNRAGRKQIPHNCDRFRSLHSGFGMNMNYLHNLNNIGAGSFEDSV